MGPSRNARFIAADQEWRIALNRTVPIVVLSLSDHVVKGRFAGRRAFDAPRRLQPEGFAGVFIKLVETAAAEMDVLSTSEWQALEQGVADLFLTMVAGESGPAVSTAPSVVALFDRVTLAIERRLHDPHLTARHIARAEGISERYLQKLFEQNDVSFGQYLRDRRLERARSALVSPGDVHTAVADVAYRCGFGDAANFNRLFKERFGSPPGAFRSRHADGSSESGRAAQRGWPLSALANPKHKQRSAIHGAVDSGPPDPRNGRDEAAHHRLAVSSANVHWGYFSRSLRPVLEIRSGDSVEVETLTQHASDDPELMIRGDGATEEVFLWTKDRKGVDRRGAGPLDASIFGRGAGEGFGVHICTGPISIQDAEPGDVVEVRINDMTPRPSRSPGYEGRCFGSNVAAWWGYHYGELIEEPKPRENVTIYEIFADGDEGYAQALYAYRWSSSGRSLRRPSPNLRLSRRSSREGHGRDLPRFSEWRPHSAASTFRRDRPRAARSRPGRIPFRRLISAAISTTGASARARPYTCPSRCPGAFYRSVIRTPRRGMAKSAAPPSNAR